MRRKKTSSFKSIIFIFILVIAVSSVYYNNFFEAPTGSSVNALNANSVQVFFSPDGNCDEHVIQAINSANNSIDIAMYSFTLDEIGEAVVKAKQRGVRVRVVVEKQQVSKYSEYWRMIENNVSVFNDTNSGFMHDKFAVIDGKIVLTGSYNWTKHATYSNNENLIIINSKEVASEYEQEFERIYSEAKQ